MQSHAPLGKKAPGEHQGLGLGVTLGDGVKLDEGAMLGATLRDTEDVIDEDAPTVRDGVGVGVPDPVLVGDAAAEDEAPNDSDAVGVLLGVGDKVKEADTDAVIVAVAVAVEVGVVQLLAFVAPVKSVVVPGAHSVQLADPGAAQRPAIH